MNRRSHATIRMDKRPYRTCGLAVVSEGLKGRILVRETPGSGQLVPMNRDPTPPKSLRAAKPRLAAWHGRRQGAHGAPLRPGAGAAHEAGVTQVPVSYGTARGGAARCTARSGCATMAVPAKIGPGPDPDSSGQAARATWRGRAVARPPGVTAKMAVLLPPPT